MVHEKGKMIYSRGDLNTVYFLGILEGRKTIEIVKETVSQGRNLHTNPAYKRLSLVDRYAPRVNGNLLAKLNLK